MVNKSENVSRTLIAAVAILAVLSLAGNALVIWYIKQTAPKPYDDSILAMRIGRIEDEDCGSGRPGKRFTGGCSGSRNQAG